MSPTAETNMPNLWSKYTVVKIKDAKIKWHVIKSAIKLREIEKYKGTYINPDLTVEQRKQEFQLRAELKKKRSEDPACKYIIKRGKIVTCREWLSLLLHDIEGMKSKYKLLTQPNPLDFDVLLCTETFLTKLWTIPNFRVFNSFARPGEKKNKKTGRPTEGLLIAINDNDTVEWH